MVLLDPEQDVTFKIHEALKTAGYDVSTVRNTDGTWSGLSIELNNATTAEHAAARALALPIWEADQAGL